MNSHDGALPDLLHEARRIKRIVQFGVYGTILIIFPLFYVFLDYSIKQVVINFAVGMMLAITAIELAFWQILKLRKQSAYPNYLAVELGAVQDLSEACALSLHLACHYLNATAGLIARVDESQRLETICSVGMDGRSDGARPTKQLADALGRALAGQQLIAGKGAKLSIGDLEFEESHNVAIVPLAAVDRTSTVMLLAGPGGDLTDRKLLRSMGIIIGLTLDNLRLTNREYQSIMQVLCSALDMRDSATQGHSQRVARMASLVAEEMGLPGQEVRRIERAAALHDIGKIGVADAVLTKPGPLTEEEWIEMRRHPGLGYGIVAGIESLQHAAEIIHSHHERHDGRGYPRGLERAEIPIGARIFSVVDSYDAMTSHRPYRRARSHKDAIEEIVRNSGSQFDPAAVSAFLEVNRAGLIAPHDSSDSATPATEARAVAVGEPWDPRNRP